METKLRLGINKNHNSLATEITIESEIYDGIIPIKIFKIEHLIENIHPDRFAIASVLMFKPYIAGQMTLPSGCSPEVARGIEEFLKPIDVSVLTVESKPFSKPKGHRKAVILEERIENSKVRLFEDNYDLTFSLSNSHQFKSSISIDQICVSSNLNAMASSDESSNILKILGLCVLCAEDAYINCIKSQRLNSDYIPDFDQLVRLLVLSNIFINI